MPLCLTCVFASWQEHILDYSQTQNTVNSAQFVWNVYCIIKYHQQNLQIQSPEKTDVFHLSWNYNWNYFFFWFLYVFVTRYILHLHTCLCLWHHAYRKGIFDCIIHWICKDSICHITVLGFRSKRWPPEKEQSKCYEMISLPRMIFQVPNRPLKYQTWMHGSITGN